MLNMIGTCARFAARRQVCAIRPLSVLRNGVSSVELEEELGHFPSVKLRGLPYDTSLDDIAEFLNGLRPLDIVVPTNNTNGSIGVLFSTLADVDAVMKRDKDSIGSRYIDVIRIPRSEYYNMALDSVSRESDGDANMMGADEGSVVKMTGLPFQASFVDIQKFFTGFNISAENVIIEAKPDGRPAGNAYVRFSSPSEAIQALKHDKKYMGSRYVNLQVTKTQFAENCLQMNR